MRRTVLTLSLIASLAFAACDRPAPDAGPAPTLPHPTTSYTGTPGSPAATVIGGDTTTPIGSPGTPSPSVSAGKGGSLGPKLTLHDPKGDTGSISGPPQPAPDIDLIRSTVQRGIGRATLLELQVNGPFPATPGNKSYTLAFTLDLDKDGSPDLQVGAIGQEDGWSPQLHDYRNNTEKLDQEFPGTMSIQGAVIRFEVRLDLPETFEWRTFSVVGEMLGGGAVAGYDDFLPDDGPTHYP